jgi:hypothetical protein
MALTKIRYYGGIIPESPGALNIGDSTNFVATVTAQDFNSVSDLKLKTNIESIDAPLDKIESLNGVLFKWKSSGEVSGGVIAQEVLEVLPELVGNTEDGTLSVNYNGIIGLLIESIKELKSEIDSIKSHK